MRVASDGRDLAAVGVSCLGVVVALRIAFVVFTPERTLGMLLCFAGGLLLGLAGPVVYTVWVRRRPPRDLGVGLHNRRATLVFALLLGAARFAITLWGYDLPAPADWVPLLVMALTVGVFEAVFFRGFVRGRLEASSGTAPAVAGAAGLHALYHVGYGTALGSCGSCSAWASSTRSPNLTAYWGNIVVLWPLLIPSARSSTTSRRATSSFRGPRPRGSRTSSRSWPVAVARRSTTATPLARGRPPLTDR